MTKQQKKKLEILKDLCIPLNKGEVEQLLSRVSQVGLDQLARYLIFKGE